MRSSLENGEGRSRAGGQENSRRDYRARGPTADPFLLVFFRLVRDASGYSISGMIPDILAAMLLRVNQFARRGFAYIAYLSINYNGRAERVRQLGFDVDDN